MSNNIFVDEFFEDYVYKILLHPYKIYHCRLIYLYYRYGANAHTPLLTTVKNSQG